MKQSLKSLIRSRRSLVMGYHLLDNLLYGWRSRKGPVSDRCGARLSAVEPGQGIAYANLAYSEYVEHFRPDRPVAGARILEIGYGDNLGVPLLFLAHGAAQVTCIERFDVVRNPREERLLYRRLREQLAGPERERFDAALELSGNGYRLTTDRIEIRHNMPVEDLARAANESFDYILSKAVLEHVADVPAAFAAMDALLVPGGRMIHHVDLRDHGIFTRGGFPPLEFLTVSPGLWRAMMSRSGKPNRVPVAAYRQILDSLGYEYRILIAHLTGIEQELVPNRESVEEGVDYQPEHGAAVEAIRPRLAAPFRDLPARDLLIAAFALVADKPRQ